MENELLTINEVATALRVDATTVRRWIQQGLVAAVTLPHPGKRLSYRIKRADLDKMMQPQEAKP